MTQTKHTPGPWTYDDKYVLRGSNGKRVGDMDKTETLTEDRYHQVMGDRRLKAAAPDMLEALKNCLNFIENTESEHDVTLSCGVIARAAIAKAEGR